jgi:glycogen phosphorylase
MSDIAERSLHTRTARSVEAIRRSFMDNLFYVAGKTIDTATATDHYTALSYTIRDRLLARFIASTSQHKQQGAKSVAYLSAEFLIGPQLGNNILNLGLWNNTRQAMVELGLDLDAIMDTEPEPGLGNGGLGRLAACFMDSLATLEIPAIGYGIRYEYGIFDQIIRDGWQIEVADAWLRNGNPWELPNLQRRYAVKLGGYTEHYHDDAGNLRIRWIAETTIHGLAYDTPILGYGVLNVNLLRLWKSEARESFDLQAFNTGDYYGAVDDMVAAQNICKVLYPNDEPEAGKNLRLRQQYFFVSCSLQDMLCIALQDNGRPENFPEKFVIQLNDTHPAIAIAELMRLLVDEHHLPWNHAWEITRGSFAYTNHTLLPEALETWPIELFRSNLPRHLEIIFEINARFLDEIRLTFMDDAARIVRMSLIDESGEKQVRMANLACVGGFAINGVSKLHTELLKTTVLREFHDLWPEKFSNKTNGVTPRRFIALANRPLAVLLEEVVDNDWLGNLDQLRRLESYADDASFRLRWHEVKRTAKIELSKYIREVNGIVIDPDSLFDIQAKRIHEYKRQHLNLLHIISLYQRMKHDAQLDHPPRTFIFSGKAAPGYHMAKLIIKLINSVADVINRDPHTRDRLKVVFVPDLSVKLGQRLYPAADLSEQISTAGMEASGTGNMKFSMNGALTIGTPDGANIEIREAVGEENFFLFGLDANGVKTLRTGNYSSHDYIERVTLLREALNLLASGFFSHGNSDLFAPLLDNIWNHDPYLVCADFSAYAACQEEISRQYKDQDLWYRMSILNVARIGYFSSDRAVSDYCQDIWKVQSVSIN